jgi:hypothetical protein
MKSSQSLKVSLLLFALSLVSAAFAADVMKGTFQISAPTQVNGTTLPAGEYVAKWSGSGPTVQVSIARDGKTVVTAPATLVQSEGKASLTAAEIQNSAAGARELIALRFSGKTYSLQLVSPATEAKSADSTK